MEITPQIGSTSNRHEMAALFTPYTQNVRFRATHNNNTTITVTVNWNRPNFAASTEIRSSTKFRDAKMDWYIGSEWQMPRKGLRKQVLALDFTKLDKPHLVSTVLVRFEPDAQLYGRTSKYLAAELLGQEQQLEMGGALTPIDCYVELLLQQMLVGERSRCYIRTRNAAEEVTFVVTLLQILQTKETHKLTVAEMYALALRYKESGVAMFKQYPPFAHDYFARAAKCLISYKPFENLTLESDGVAGTDMQALFVQVQTNLAACLLTQQRYEDVIYQTQFVETQHQPTEKSIYRRAMALYSMKEYEKAEQLIKQVPGYQEKRDFVKLHQRITDSWKSSNEHYKHVVQRMFS